MTGLVQGGYYAGAQQACEYMYPLSKTFASDPTIAAALCSTEANGCCPPSGVTPSTSTTCTARGNACAVGGSCVVSSDGCNTAFVSSGLTTCSGTGCALKTNYYYPGLYSHNSAGQACVNTTKLATCTASSSQTSCNGLSGCVWSFSCSAGAAYQCDGTDVCCQPLAKGQVANGALYPWLSSADEQTCSTKTGVAVIGRSTNCTATGLCRSITDRCASYSNPWDCNTQKGCVYDINGATGNYGGRCRLLVDSCAQYDQITCQQTPGCTTAKLCQSDLCSYKSGESDRCCGKRTQSFLTGYGNVDWYSWWASYWGSCESDPSCKSAPICIPAFDDCEFFSAETCTQNSWCRVRNGRCQINDFGTHPCNAAPTALQCDAMTFSLTGKQRCRTRTLCQDRCISCKSCINLANTFVNSLPSNARAAGVGTAWLDYCTSQGIASPFMCSQLATNIRQSYNGNLGRRPAALCSWLNICPYPWYTFWGYQGCNATVNGVTAGLDQCTTNGIVGGPSATANNVQVNSTTCIADGWSQNTCPSNKPICEPSNIIGYDCSCNYGYDYCRPVGNCVDFCNTADSLKYIDTINSRYTYCNSTNPCSGGDSCIGNLTISQCQAVACNPNAASNPFTLSTCTGTCLPANNLMSSAQFANTSKDIIITLNTVAADGSYLAGDLFDDTTVTALGGTAATAVIALKTMTVTLTGKATLTVGGSITLKSGQTVLKDVVLGRPFSGSVSVTNCTACGAPFPSISMPTLIPEPCDVTKCNDIAIDASSSYGRAGRPLRYAWSTSQTSGPLFTATNGKNSSIVYLKCADLASMTNGVYDVTVTVFSFLGVPASTTFSFRKMAKGSVPLVTVLGGSNQVFQVSSGFRLTAVVDTASVCNGSVMRYTWDATSPWTAVSSTVATKDLIVPGPVDASDGDNFKIALGAGFLGKSDKVSVNVSLAAQGTPLVVTLYGNRGDVRNDTWLYFWAWGQDPDDPSNTVPISYAWSCLRDDLQPCFKTKDFGNRGATNWYFPAGLLDVGVNHTFSITVIKGGRTSTDSIRIRPFDSRLPIPTGYIYRSCPWTGCGGKTNPSETIYVTVYKDWMSSVTTYKWNSNYLALTDANSQVSTYGGWYWGWGGQGPWSSSLTIMPAALPPSGLLTVTGQMSYTATDGTTYLGSASITMTMNLAPYCLTSSCLTMEVVNASAPFSEVKLRFTPGGIADDDRTSFLKYEFGLYVSSFTNQSYVTNYPLSYFTAVGLPVGKQVVYGCVIDTYGARYCERKNVTITEMKLSPAAAAAAMAGLDFNALKATGDPGAVSLAASRIAALAASSTGSSDAVKSAVSNAVDSVVSVMNFKDPSATSQALTTFSSLTSNSANLNPSTGRNIMGCANNILQGAFAATDTTYTYDFGTKICAALGAGLSTTNAARRMLQASAGGATMEQAVAAFEQVSDSAANLQHLLLASQASGAPPTQTGQNDLTQQLYVTVWSALPATLVADYIIPVGPEGATNLNTTCTITYPTDYSNETISGWPGTVTDANGTRDGSLQFGATYYPDDDTITRVATAVPFEGPSISDVQIRSGFLNITQQGRDPSASICNQPATSTNDCPLFLTITIPVSNWTTNSNYSALCMRLDTNTGRYSGYFENAVISRFIGYNASTDSVTCEVNTYGLWTAVQYIGPPRRIPSPPPPSLPPGGANVPSYPPTYGSTPPPPPAVSLGSTRVRYSLVFASNLNAMSSSEQLSFSNTVNKYFAEGLANLTPDMFLDDFDNVEYQRVVVGTLTAGTRAARLLQSVLEAVGAQTRQLKQTATTSAPTAVYPAEPYSASDLATLQNVNTAQAQSMFGASGLDLLSLEYLGTDYLDTDDGGLSGGAIAGIVIGVVFGCIILIAIIAFVIMRKKRSSVEPRQQQPAQHAGHEEGEQPSGV